MAFSRLFEQTQDYEGMQGYRHQQKVFTRLKMHLKANHELTASRIIDVVNCSKHIAADI